MPDIAIIDIASQFPESEPFHQLAKNLLRVDNLLDHRNQLLASRALNGVVWSSFLSPMAKMERGPGDNEEQIQKEIEKALAKPEIRDVLNRQVGDVNLIIKNEINLGIYNERTEERQKELSSFSLSNFTLSVLSGALAGIIAINAPTFEEIIDGASVLEEETVTDQQPTIRWRVATRELYGELNIRTTPDRTSASNIAWTVRNGSLIEVLGQEGDMYEVHCSNPDGEIPTHKCYAAGEYILPFIIPNIDTAD